MPQKELGTIKSAIESTGVESELELLRKYHKWKMLT